MTTFFCIITIILIYLLVIKEVNIKTLLAKVKSLLTKVKALPTNAIVPLPKLDYKFQVEIISLCIILTMLLLGAILLFFVLTLLC